MLYKVKFSFYKTISLLLGRYSFVFLGSFEQVVFFGLIYF
ncbi:hypothetical protein Vi05172_g11080 [Venturia inaequalis]|nr:hypothetical protein Vi05172_g11080 [Venturia inaequalis]